MKDNKVLASHSETTSLPDGTKLKITINNYENRIFPLGDPYMSEARIDYVTQRGTRYLEYYANHLSETDMIKGANHIIDSIKKDPNTYRHQHAPK